MKNKEIALIFACGESIIEHKKEIPKLIEKFTCLGVNRFPSKFVNEYRLWLKYGKSLPVDYWMLNDIGAIEEYIIPKCKEQKLIINRNLHPELKPLRKAGFNFHYLFGHDDENPVLVENGLLFGKYSTTVQAVNFMLLQGFKDIVIFGMDNTPIFKHFYKDTSIREKSLDQRIDIDCQLTSLSNHCNIYKTSRESMIKFPIIDVDELLNNEVIKVNDITNLVEEIKLSQTEMIHPSCKNGTLYYEKRSFSIKDFKFYCDNDLVGKFTKQGFKIKE